MLKNRTGLLVSLCVLAPAANAGTLTIENADITLSGGAAGGYYYSTNTGSNNNDNYLVSDFLAELSHEAETGGVGFTAAFGTLQAVTVADGGVNNSTTYSDFDLQYGWLTVKPLEGLTIDVGRLATNVGYEVTPSYLNPHATIAAIWGGQPVYYPGVRATYEINDISIYAEANDDSLSLNGANARMARAIGIGGSAGSFDYLVSYYNYLSAKDMVDIILSTSVGNVDLALNVDYHLLDDAAKIPGADDSAYGVAFYVSPHSGKMSYPVRLEYLSDGTSNIYGGIDSGYTLTVTPTYHASENTFVRAEVSYATTDIPIFTNSNGAAKDNKTSFAFQIGYLF